MRTRLWRDLLGRYAAVQRQTRLIGSLRAIAGVPADADLSEKQWSVIESELRRTGGRIAKELKETARDSLGAAPSLESARELSTAVGRSEMTLSRHFDTFDLLLDVLSQRRVPEIGPLLAGCDVLALDALDRHERLAVYTQPLVYLDRGFGASILREGVPLSAGTTNVIPLIQIPYSKLSSKYGLTSVVHEVGHQALEGLGIAKPLAAAVRDALASLGAPRPVQRQFGLWAKELGPDYWVFCACGVAQASSLREILSLPPATVFSLAPADPHPPPYLRVLFSFYWCRRQWGQGYWGALERDWRRLYPLSSAPRQVQETLRDYERYIPTVSRVFFEHRFRQTERRPLSALFPLDAIHPRRLHRIAKAGVARRILQFGGLSPCAQLAVFRTMKDFEMVSAEGLDNLMSRWLKRLAARKRLECLPARKHYPIWSMEERRECLRKHAKNTSRSSLRLPKRSLQSRL